MAALEFDVKAAQDVLTMFADAGEERIRVQDLLQQCMARIENWQGLSPVRTWAGAWRTSSASSFSVGANLFSGICSISRQPATKWALLCQKAGSRSRGQNY